MHRRAPRRLGAIVATAVLLTLALSACEGEFRTTKQTAYLAEMRVVYPELKQHPDTEILNGGGSICALLDTGTTVLEAHDELVRQGMSDEKASILVLVAAMKLCPEHAPPATQ